MIKRLFDIVQERSGQNPNDIMLAAKESLPAGQAGGQWRTYSCKEVWDTSRKLAGGLASLGFLNQVMEPGKQEKIAIISPNRPEWIMTDIGVQLTGAVLTPIYPTISPSEIAYILNESEVQVLFVANADIYERFKEALAGIPTLKSVYSFDEIAGVKHWKELTNKNLEPDEKIIAAIQPDTLATIIYTSGTTGNPKGVMLTHNNIVSNVIDSMPAFTFAGVHTRALSFLPLNHIFERMVSYIYMQAGVSIYYAESMDTIGFNLKEVQPIVFTTVPRLLEKVYERIMNTGMDLKGIKRALFFWALELGKQYDNVNHGSVFYSWPIRSFLINGGKRWAVM